MLDDAGRALGALCVMDTEPRSLNHRDIMLLENLAADVVTTAQMERDEREHAPVTASPTQPPTAAGGPAEAAPA